MTDRRALWSNGRVAHESLSGQVTADRFTSGEAHRVTWAPTTDLCDAPDGNRDRQLLWGQVFCVLDVEEGWAFGFAQADGYTGYVEADDLTPITTVNTHRVIVRQSLGHYEPNIKDTKDEPVFVSMGTEVAVTEADETWSTILGLRRAYYVPTRHLAPLNTFERDPVTVAGRLLGTPYLWGGNSMLGIDCSGLVQIACRLCGIPCPGDSDLQEAALGQTMTPGTAPQRGDLFFWKGHVAWVADPDTLLHANAHHMAVAYEPLRTAVWRIQDQGDGPVTRHARLTLG